MSTVVAAVSAVCAQKWSIISSQVGQGAAGLGFFDANTGIIGTSDGLGYVVYKSTDGGKTWPTEVPNQNFYLFPLFDTSAFGSVGVAVGQYDAQYTVNKGGNFNTSSGGAGALNSRVLGAQQGFGIIGQFSNNDNGVAVSTDFGLTFTEYNTSLTTAAGYGAFPSTSVFYVTGATVPQSADDNSGGSTTGTGTGSTTGTGGSGSTTAADASPAVAVKRLSSRASLVAPRGGPAARHVFDFGTSMLRGRALQTGGYAGEIAQSTDGGSTWTTTFSTATFALNGIDCASTSACCAVGDNADAAYIVCTSNSGSSWTTTYTANTTGASLIDIRAISATEYWAVGGAATSTALQATFLHSTNGGQSWTVDTTLPNYFATGIECIASAGTCWATVVDTNDNSYVASTA